MAWNRLRRALTACRLIERPQLVCEIVEDFPSPGALRPGTLHVVQDADLAKWAVTPCPCGCGTTLQLSLSRSRRPRWSVRSDWLGRPSVTPSVRQPDGCRAHFWITDGRIEWCRDSGRPSGRLSA